MTDYLLALLVVMVCVLIVAVTNLDRDRDCGPRAQTELVRPPD